MKKIKINRQFIGLFAMFTLCFGLFSFTANFGLDGYEIYLNDKLVLKQYINQPLNLRVLQLDKAKPDDQLRISYNHCRTKDGAGTGRNISLKDEKGNTLKKWSFADADGTDLKMSMPVKELLLLKKSHSNDGLILYYSSRELPKAEMLAMLN